MSIAEQGVLGLDQAVTESQNCSCQEFSQLISQIMTLLSKMSDRVL